eukprot:COSAG01_NODE_132_length_24759_cov_13.862298_35_plen_91_part_00
MVNPQLASINCTQNHTAVTAEHPHLATHEVVERDSMRVAVLVLRFPRFPIALSKSTLQIDPLSPSQPIYFTWQTTTHSGQSRKHLRHRSR